MGVYGKKIIIDPALLPSDLNCSPYDLPQFVNIFAALLKAIKRLETFYDNPTISPTQRPFPYLNSFIPIGTNSSRISFTYASVFDPSSDRLLFVVNTTTNESLLVKFSRRYGKDAHLECSALGIAPRLLGFETLPGGWFAAVMELLPPSFRLLSDLPKTNLKVPVIEAMQRMHEAGFVHGDLRYNNILVDEVAENSVRIVDWDWAGRQGEVKYPISINPEVPRSSAATGGAEILDEHDRYSISLIFH